MKAETARWIGKAIQDLDGAEYLLIGERFELACFSAQQAAEKALKAVLIEREGKAPRIHSLLPLAKAAGAPESLNRACLLLTPAYTAFRYPDVEETVTPDDARTLVQAAKEVVAWARRLLS